MNDHDLLCPWLTWPEFNQSCRCDLIAKVRADEQEKIARAIEAKGATYFELEYRWVAENAARIARNGGSDE